MPTRLREVACATMRGTSKRSCLQIFVKRLSLDIVDIASLIAQECVFCDPVTPTQAMSATADENGDADITLYEGREYRLIASTSGNREPACAGPVKFIAKQGLQVGTLTLDKSWDECRALQKVP